MSAHAPTTLRRLRLASVGAALFASSAASQAGPCDSTTFAHTASLSGVGLLAWSLCGNSEVQMKVSAPTTGWFGIGFMTAANINGVGADMVVGQVTGSTVSVYDMYKTNNLPPVLDTSLSGTSDIHNVSGSESGGWTSFSFTRSLNTGDTTDVALDQGPVTLYYMLSLSDAAGQVLPQQDWRGWTKGFNFVSSVPEPQSPALLLAGLALTAAVARRRKV